MVVAEGAAPKDGHTELVEPAEIGHAERLGGLGERVAKALQERTGKDTRVVVLGHLLRGGSPTSFDRLLGLRFGAAAVRALEQGIDGVMVTLQAADIVHVPLSEVAGRQKTIPLDCDTMLTARDMAISFGDRSLPWPTPQRG